MKTIIFVILIAIIIIGSMIPLLILHNFDYETITAYYTGATVGCLISFLMFYKFIDDKDKNGRTKR